nr:phage terminase small subunit P27 family [Propylenella binzhouense]
MASAPRPPTWLSKDAKAEWKRIMPLLIERRVITDADMGSVENYCVSIGRVREIERMIRAAGTVDPALFRMQDKATQTARQLAAELGLTPVSRSRPSVRNDDDDDDLSPLAL